MKAARTLACLTCATVALARAGVAQSAASPPPPLPPGGGLVPALKWEQLGYDVEGKSQDKAGHSVAYSAGGTRMAVGAPDNDGNGKNAGEVRVFEYSAFQGWVQMGASLYGQAAGDNFGHAVALSADGTRVAVGAPDHDNDRGQVRMYHFTADNGWEETGDGLNGEATDDHFGWSVAISASGSRLAVGAKDNDGSGDKAGHVRVFDYSVNRGWAQVGPDIDGEAAGDRSGSSLSMSADGTRLAVGAPKNNGAGGKISDAGHVRIFEYDASTSTFEQLGLDVDGESYSDWSGYSVSLSGDGMRVAVGAHQSDGDQGHDQGHVRVFDFCVEAKNWAQIGSSLVGDGAYYRFGYAVALSYNGTRLAVSAPRTPGVGGSHHAPAGAVQVYELYDDQYVPAGSSIGGRARHDWSGEALAISNDGTKVAIGARKFDGTYDHQNDDAGHVRVFDSDKQGPSNELLVMGTLEGIKDAGPAICHAPGESIAVLSRSSAEYPDYSKLYPYTIEVTNDRCDSSFIAEKFTQYAGLKFAFEFSPEVSDSEIDAACASGFSELEETVPFPSEGELEALSCGHWWGYGEINKQAGREPRFSATAAGNAINDFYYNVVLRGKVAMPDYDGLFNCPDDMRAVMCCWTRDRQAGDNNGNCGSGRTRQDCTYADPGDNTEVCDLDSTDNDQEAVHCHGFAYPESDVKSDDNPYWENARYAGNLMYYVSMYDHPLQRGYVEGVNNHTQSDERGHFAELGAPMCGCTSVFEDMGFSVARADCTEIEKVEYTYSVTINAPDSGLDRVVVHAVKAKPKFRACRASNNNSVFAFYNDKIKKDGDRDIETVIHGNNDGDCPDDK